MIWGVIGERIRALIEENARMKDAAPDMHLRKCWDCQNTAMHVEAVTPWVLCRICGSQDTRKVKMSWEGVNNAIFDLGQKIEEKDREIETLKEQIRLMHKLLIGHRLRRLPGRKDLDRMDQMKKEGKWL